LSRALSRSQARPLPAGTLATVALSLFDVPFQEDRQAPVAAFACLGDTGQAPSGYCLCADPVHLRADTHGLILFDAATFTFSDPESQALLGAVAEFLAVDGWQLVHTRSGRWYLQGTEQQELLTTPLPLLRGSPVADFLPRGKDAPAWRQRFNEIQMLMHAHPVNRQRAERSQPLVNSLWIWGGGLLPAPGRKCFDRVVTDNAVTRGLAEWNTANCMAVPDSADCLLNDMAQGERVLVTLDALDIPAAYDDFELWNTVLERYERDWFEPLISALAKRRLSTVDILPVNGRRYRSTFTCMLKFWQRARSYRDVLTMN